MKMLIKTLATRGGSRLTFTDDGDEYWTSGNVLVELEDDAELVFERAADPEETVNQGEGGTYDVDEKDNGYFGIEKE